MLPGVEVQAHMAAMGSCFRTSNAADSTRTEKGGGKPLPKTSSYELRVVPGCAHLGSIS